MTGRPDEGDDPRLAEVLRRALARSADEIHPLGDGLTKIRARTARSRRQRWLVPLAAAAASVVVAGGVAWGANALGQNDDREPPVAAGTTSVVVSSPPTTGPTTGSTAVETTPVPLATVPVYYLGAQPSDGGPAYKVFREFRRVPTHDASDRAERVRIAITEMFKNAPLDDDYFGTWPSTAKVVDVSVDTDSAIVTVDLTGLEWTDVRLPDPDGRLVEDVGAALVQELVYTATAAASKITTDDGFSATGGVRLLVDGAPVDSMLGVDTSDPVKRDPIGYQATIWITDPEFGEVVGDPITVRLVANLFEGGPPQWELTQDGVIMASDVGSTGEGGRWDDYEFTIDGVPPGTYQLEVFDVGGRGDRDFAPYDTKTITVE
jgi:hypothetical protein